MSIQQLYELLTEVVRQGPGHVVAYGLGLATLAFFWLSLFWLVKRPYRRRVAALTEENITLREARAVKAADLKVTSKEVESLRAERSKLGEEIHQTQQARAKLESRLECIEAENVRLRDERAVAAAESRELREGKADVAARLEIVSAEKENLWLSQRTLTLENGQTKEAKARLEAAVEKSQDDNTRLHQQRAEMSDELERRAENESQLEIQVAELTEQVQRLADFDGKIWERPRVVESAVFRPLEKRKVPILVFANLKGGVGKTTLSANLGAALARKEKRVLLVDLDYQGSLTSLCMQPAEIQEIRRKNQFVDRLFVNGTVDDDTFNQCCHRVAELPKVRLLAADEPLVDVENRLMAQWLLRPEGLDARYLLRSYLHSAAVEGEYDYVLIDCPPRLTTACVNAFTSADLLLIPVLLDRTSAEAVPRQLRAIRKLKRLICPDLEIAGLVGNRVNPRKQMIDREQRLWESLPATCETAWGETVYPFSTLIRHNRAFAEAASESRFAALRRGVDAMFRDLAEEVQQRIADHACEGSATVST